MFKTNLLQLGNFTLHAGGNSYFKIECDALKKKDWETLAKIVSVKYAFGEVYGIPRGGLQFAKALESYIPYPHPNILIVDDVYNTGMSMEKAKEKFLPKYRDKNIIGVVAFARNPTPNWIKPIFQMW